MLLFWFVVVEVVFEAEVVEFEFEGVAAFEEFRSFGEGRSWYPAAELFLLADLEREVVLGAFPTPATTVDLDLLPVLSLAPLPLD